jgi:hypothetical protein
VNRAFFGRGRHHAALKGTCLATLLSSRFQMRSRSKAPNARAWTPSAQTPALDPDVIPAVGVLGDRRRDDLRAVEVEARPAGGAVEEAQHAVLAGVPAPQPSVRQHLDREVAGLAAVAGGEQDLLSPGGFALLASRS